MIRLAGAYESRGHITADGVRCGAVFEDLSGLPASPFGVSKPERSLACIKEAVDEPMD